MAAAGDREVELLKRLAARCVSLVAPGVRWLRAVALLSSMAAASAVTAEAQAPAPASRPGARIADRIRSGFVETVIADSINSPVSFGVAPDGLILVCEQGGRLRAIRRDSLRSRPFVTLPVVVGAEEGLVGVAFDPGFARNRWVYVCYTAAAPSRHNRIERFTAAGDTARAGSGLAIFEFDDNLDQVHVGGALRFGRDGKLYAGTGENGEGALSQSLRSTHGKLLRLEPNGGIPADNPFYKIALGNHRAIWARGLRNAFAIDVEPRTGRIFVNDVGGDAFEEVNEGKAGVNYGWPMVEGPSAAPRLEAPIHSYGHDAGCAITGGAFYAPPRRGGFPREWSGRYL